MKRILVSEVNAPAIQNRLDMVNGKAGTHVFIAREVVDLAKLAEERLQWRILKKDMVGARFTARSGRPVANKYGARRIGNEAVFERRVKGWYLVSLARCSLSTYGGGETALFLTPAQDKAAVAAFRAKYSILKTHLETPVTRPLAATAPAA